MMLAERSADLIRGREVLHVAQASLLADPEWETRQRSQDISCDYSSNREALHAALLMNAKKETPTRSAS